MVIPFRNSGGVVIRKGENEKTNPFDSYPFLRAAAAPAQMDALSLAWSEAARAVMRFARKEAPL